VVVRRAVVVGWGPGRPAASAVVAIRVPNQPRPRVWCRVVAWVAKAC